MTSRLGGRSAAPHSTPGHRLARAIRARFQRI